MFLEEMIKSSKTAVKTISGLLQRLTLTEGMMIQKLRQEKKRCLNHEYQKSYKYDDVYS